MIGGKAIAAGGFGCIFKPALLCKTKKKIPSGVSKLMTYDDTETEYLMLTDIIDKVRSVPMYDRYFALSDIFMCKPKKITEQQFKGFNKTCKNFTKRNITKSDINKNISEYGILNMPDNGIELTHVLNKLQTASDVIKINNSLIELFKNGIVKMNNRGVYHTDIKTSNILVKNGRPRLIDWGSALITKNYNPKHDGRPIQYNQPTTIILVNPRFLRTYEDFLRANKITDKLTHNSLEKLAVLLKSTLLNSSFTGHLDVLVEIYGTFTRKNDVSRNKKEVLKTIVNYLMKVLYKHTNKGRFNATKYFHDIFLHNCDIIGFLSCYENIFIWLRKNKFILPALYLKKVYLRHMFDISVDKFSVNRVIRQLNKLNTLILNKTKKMNR